MNPAFSGVKSGGRRRKAATSRPPPEPWFHGPITRVEAEERLRATGVPSGAYLVRSKGTADGEYALSLLTPKRAIHYVIKIPASTDEPITFQKKPIPPEWGSNLRAIINYFGQ